MLSEEEIEELSQSKSEAVQKLLKVVQFQAEQIKSLENEVMELKLRLTKNSSNSSKPPSSDGFKKKKKGLKSLRQKSGKKPGGQSEHEGSNLKMSAEPDQKIPLKLERCTHCGESLSEVEIKSIKKRQVYDIPQPKIEVSEYQSEVKICPCCHEENEASFPQGVEVSVQYGSRIKGLWVYLTQYQLLPYERTAQLMAVLYTHRPSTGSLVTTNERCSEKLLPFEQELKRELIHSSVIHNDETGMRVNGKLHWIHSRSTEELTLYHLDQKRGILAHQRIGILENYQGTSIHDHYKSYYEYSHRHGLCHAHHLRELKYLSEQSEQSWIVSIKELFLEMKEAKESGQLNLAKVQAIEQRYDSLVQQGLEMNPLPQRPSGKRGRLKKSATRNFLERLRDYRDSCLLYIWDKSVPFDNNLAERDLRMNKVKQKISGGFRSFEGGQHFCRIRSFISTLQKQGRDILGELNALFCGIQPPVTIPAE